MTTAILEPEQKEIVDIEITPLKLRTAYLAVKSQEERSALVVDIKKAEELKKKIEEKFHPTENKVKTREVYELSLDTEHQFFDPIDAFVAAGKKAVKTFDTNETLRIQSEQRRHREAEEQRVREEQARRDAEAKAAQEAEERRQFEEYERIEKEKKEKQAIIDSATAAGNSKIAGIAAKEVARLDGEAAKLEEDGAKKLEEIKAKAEEPIAPPPVRFTPPSAPLKKLVWKARVINMSKLCQEIGSGMVPFTVVEIKQSELNDFAKKFGSDSMRIPGLEFYQEASGRF